MFASKTTWKRQTKLSSVKLNMPKFLYYYSNLGNVNPKRISWRTKATKQ